VGTPRRCMSECVCVPRHHSRTREHQPEARPASEPLPKSKEHHQSHPLRSLPTVSAPSRLSRRRGPRFSHRLLARPCVACVIPPPPRLPQGRPGLLPPSEELPQPLDVFLSLHYARRSLIIELDPPLHRSRRRLGHDLQVPRNPGAKVPPTRLQEIIYQRRQHPPDGRG